MNSETRVWISAVLGGPLVMALTAQAQEAASSAEASTSSIVGIVAGIAGVVLVGSVLALCGSSEKAPSIRIHDPAPAPERPMQPTQPPPSNYRPAAQSHPGFSNQGYQQRPPQAPSGHGQPGYVPQYQHQSQYQQPHQPQYQQQPQQPNQYGYSPPSGRPSPYQSQPPPMHPQGSGSMRQSFPGPMSGSNSGSAPRPMQSGSFGSVDPNERVSMPYVDSYGRAVQAPPYSSSGRPDVYRVSDGTPPGPQPGPPGHARVSSPQVPPGPPGPAGIPNPTPPPRTSPSGYAAAPARSPAPQGPPTPSGPMLAPRDGSLDALAEFLRELIDKTGGRCGNGPYTIDGEQPIRKCLYSVQCTCKTTFGKSVDALFFASKTDYDRQHNICSKRPLQEFRADVREVVEASTFRDASSGLNVAVPNFIITEATSSMDDLIANMPTVQRNSTISAIATQLTTQLVMLHSKKIVHCGVTRRNIVQLGGMNAIWTFREYCSYVGEGKEMEAARHLQEVRILPPEAAEAALRQAPMIATAAMDIWQLGVLLYELYSGSNYWDADASPESILRDLSTPGGLPHEKDPAKLNAIARSSPALQPHKGIIARMLDRNPAARPNAATLKRDLIASASDITMQGNTVTSWQAPVVNIGSSAPRA